jgi:hypothetical protein
MNSKLFRVIAGISLLTFPPLLLAGFLMHPDILSLEMVHTVDALIANFRHQPLFHIGHLLVFLSVPFIIFSLSGLMTLKTEKGQMWLLAGGLVGIVGAVILAGDKGALCMVLSAFDTLPETDFQQITPALEAILQRKGQLALFYALPLLPLGAAMQLVGLIQSGYAKTASRNRGYHRPPVAEQSRYRDHQFNRRGADDPVLYSPGHQAD